MTTLTPFSRALGLTVATCAIGCVYSFQNPIEQSPAGVILGACQLSHPVPGQSLAGGTITLLNTQLTLPISGSGIFLFRAMPTGTYALKCAVPPPAQNDFPLIVERLGVQLPRAASTVADSVNTGALSIDATGIVGGAVTPVPSGGATATVAAFAVTDGGLGSYEALFAPVDAAGRFQIALPAGTHLLAASDPTRSALSLVTVPSGTTQTLNFTLAAAAVAGSLSGRLVLDGPNLGADGDPAAIAQLLGFVSYTLTDPAGAVLATGPFLGAGGGAAGGTSTGDFLLPVPATSATVTLTFTVGAGVSFGSPGDHLSTFPLPGLPVIAGQTTALDQVTWLDDADLAANAPGAGGVPAGPFAIPDAGAFATVLLPTARGRLLAAAGAPLSPNANGSVYGDGDLYVADQIGAGLSNVRWLTDAGGYFQSSLSGAVLNGDAVLAWGSNFGFQTTYTTGLGLVVVRGDGGVVWPALGAALLPEISYWGQATTTFVGQLGSTQGIFTVVPEAQTGQLDAVFTDPTTGVAQIARVVSDAGITSTLSLVGTSCALTEFQGGPGFCLSTVDTNASGQLHAFLLGVATGDGGATVVSLSNLGALPAGNLGGAPQSAMLGLAASASGAVLATVDPMILGAGNPISTTLVVAGPFRTLAQDPAIVDVGIPSTVSLLLPDPAGYLGLGGVTQVATSGVGVLLFDGGVATPTALPTLPAASLLDTEPIDAYRDPVNGLVTLPVQESAGTLSIVQLGGLP